MLKYTVITTFSIYLKILVSFTRILANFQNINTSGNLIYDSKVIQVSLSELYSSNSFHTGQGIMWAQYCTTSITMSRLRSLDLVFIIKYGST